MLLLFFVAECSALQQPLAKPVWTEYIRKASFEFAVPAPKKPRVAVAIREEKVVDPVDELLGEQLLAWAVKEHNVRLAQEVVKILSQQGKAQYDFRKIKQ